MLNPDKLGHAEGGKRVYQWFAGDGCDRIFLGRSDKKIICGWQYISLGKVS